MTKSKKEEEGSSLEPQNENLLTNIQMAIVIATLEFDNGHLIFNHTEKTMLFRCNLFNYSSLYMDCLCDSRDYDDIKGPMLCCTPFVPSAKAPEYEKILSGNKDFMTKLRADFLIFSSVERRYSFSDVDGGLFLTYYPDDNRGFTKVRYPLLPDSNINLDTLNKIMKYELPGVVNVILNHYTLID